MLTDALMPHMDGRELCRRLKETDEGASKKVIVMTSLYTAGHDGGYRMQNAEGRMQKVAKGPFCILPSAFCIPAQPTTTQLASRMYTLSSADASASNGRPLSSRATRTIRSTFRGLRPIAP